MRFLISCLFTLLLFAACQSNQKQATTSDTPVAQNTKPTTTQEAPQQNSKYPHIPVAEKGITVVSPDGWEAKTMEFHQGYCEKMLAKLGETYDASKFCECFLSKIQYYYEPIYFKEAYEDQAKWNQECLAEAEK